MLWRIVGEIGSAYFFLSALFNMPIANVSAIMQALPLAITLAAAVVFREPVGWRRMAAILAGFAGVMLIVRPGTEGFTVYSVYGLAAVAFVTLRDLATRRLSYEVPSMLVTLITSASLMVVFGLASVPQGWAPVDGRAALLIGGAAVMLIGGYLFSIMVMRVGEISVVAPFRYTSLLWALLLGWVVFGDWPSPSRSPARRSSWPRACSRSPARRGSAGGRGRRGEKSSHSVLVHVEAVAKERAPAASSGVSAGGAGPLSLSSCSARRYMSGRGSISVGITWWSL